HRARGLGGRRHYGARAAGRPNGNPAARRLSPSRPLVPTQSVGTRSRAALRPGDRPTTIEGVRSSTTTEDSADGKQRDDGPRRTPKMDRHARGAGPAPGARARAGAAPRPRAPEGAGP